MDAIEDSATHIRDYCENEIGDALRVISYYNRDEYRPLYTREDLPRETVEGERDMYRIPYMNIQKSVHHLSDLNASFDRPEKIVSYFTGCATLQFPIDERRGLVVSLDTESQLPEGFIDGCRDILGKHGP